jgi:replication fork clamp-binding protein CrfC
MSKSSFRPTKAISKLHHLSEIEDAFEYDLSPLMADIDKAGTYLSGETLMTHLHRMVMGVLACKESMWEVLKDRLRHEQYEKELRELGWDNEEGAGELQERKVFEKMLEQYKE